MEHFDCHIWGLFILFTLFLAVPGGIGDLSFPTRNRTCGPCIEGYSGLSHWTTRKSQGVFYSFKIKHIEKQLIKNTPILKVQSESWQVYTPQSICRVFLKASFASFSRHRVYHNSNSLSPLQDLRDLTCVCSACPQVGDTWQL